MKIPFDPKFRMPLITDPKACWSEEDLYAHHLEEKKKKKSLLEPSKPARRSVPALLQSGSSGAANLKE